MMYLLAALSGTRAFRHQLRHFAARLKLEQGDFRVLKLKVLAPHYGLTLALLIRDSMRRLARDSCTLQLPALNWQVIN
ncbi:hypothetical protein N9Q31_01480 [Pseudomonadales bacterium]|nr:hypothetical protein [Pseudomonadales bacterium]